MTAVVFAASVTAVVVPPAVVLAPTVVLLLQVDVAVDVDVVLVVVVVPMQNSSPLFAIEVKSSLPSTAEFSPETDLHS